MKEEYNVLSEFDGMSSGQLALLNAKKEVTNYFASEIDKHAINACTANFPGTKHLGDVTKIQIKELPKIHLFIGGSPCQGFSFAGEQLNFNDPRSKLFFEFAADLRYIQEYINPDVEFLLENVKMKKEYQNVISKFLGVEPIEINSSLLSGQSRNRLYWTNIKSIEIPEDKNIFMCDILEPNVSDKYYHSEAALNYMDRSVSGGRNHWDFGHHSDTFKQKSACITASFMKGVPYNVLIERNQVNQINPYSGCSTNQPKLQHRIFDSNSKMTCLTSSHSCRSTIYPDKEDLIRRLTPRECGRLQTISEDKLEVILNAGISDSQLYKMFGNGWTIDVITHIFKNLN